MSTRIALYSCAALAVAAFAAPAMGQTITTSFSRTDGFTTGDAGAVTLASGGFQVTFSGGQQQQMFDGPSYNTGPDAYLFINGGAFTGSTGKTTTGSSDIGLIDFNIGVTDVSFFAANRANGPFTTIRVFALDDTTLLDVVTVSQSDLRASTSPALTFFSSADFGELIGSIQIDNPGPAGNPPYVTAIDTFSATAVPGPGALLPMLGVAGVFVVRRRR